MTEYTLKAPDTWKFPLDLNVERYKSWVQFRLGTKKTNAYIVLPTPPNISFNTSMKYNEVSLGVISGAFDTFNNSLKDSGGDLTLNNVGGAIKDTAMGVWNGTVNSESARTSGGLSTQIAMAASMLKTAGLSSVYNVISPLETLAKQELRERGIAINPNTELYFQDVGLRSFSFKFRMVAKSHTESLQIREIVTLFEKASHPSNKEKFIFEYPDECIITFWEGDQPNDLIPAINTCVIKNFSHVYNADTNAFFDTGAPVTVDISLTFQEISINTKETINRYQSDTDRNVFSQRRERTAENGVNFDLESALDKITSRVDATGEKVNDSLIKDQEVLKIRNREELKRITKGLLNEKENTR